MQRRSFTLWRNNVTLTCLLGLNFTKLQGALSALILARFNFSVNKRNLISLISHPCPQIYLYFISFFFVNKTFFYRHGTYFKDKRELMFVYSFISSFFKWNMKNSRHVSYVDFHSSFDSNHKWLDLKQLQEVLPAPSWKIGLHTFKDFSHQDNWFFCFLKIFLMFIWIFYFEISQNRGNCSFFPMNLEKSPVFVQTTFQC